MDRSLTLSPAQISLLLDIVRDDYERQAFEASETLTPGDQELQDDFRIVIRKLETARQ
jgi:hypothetical protein